MINMNPFKLRLQSLIDENQLNHLRLANKIGISSTSINGYFNYGYYPQIDIAIKMTKIFNCSLDYLFCLSDDYGQEPKLTTEDISKNFFNSFDKFIKTHHIYIANAMKKLSMSEYNYYRWKTGQMPKTINLISIAQCFNLSIDSLLSK